MCFSTHLSEPKSKDKFVKVELDRKKHTFYKTFFCQFLVYQGVLRKTNQLTTSRISSEKLDEENV